MQRGVLSRVSGERATRDPCEEVGGGGIIDGMDDNQWTRLFRQLAQEVPPGGFFDFDPAARPYFITTTAVRDLYLRLLTMPHRNRYAPRRRRQTHGRGPTHFGRRHRRR